MKTSYSTVARCRGALFATAGVAALAFGAPAFAHDTTADEADCVDANDNGVCDTSEPVDSSAAVPAEGMIVVTGSRIARPSISSPVPLTSVIAG